MLLAVIILSCFDTFRKFGEHQEVGGGGGIIYFVNLWMGVCHWTLKPSPHTRP